MLIPKYTTKVLVCFVTHLSFQSGYIGVGTAGTAGSLKSHTKAALDADPTTHLLVIMSASTGGGRSFTSSPCGGDRFRYSKSGCGRLGYGGAINCAQVSI